MKILNVIRKIEKIWFYISLLLIGILFVAVSSFIIASPKEELISTTGEIKQIETYIDSFNENQYRVIVSYTDNNGTYHENIEYPSYSSSMKEGNEVTILYNPDSPELIQAPGSEYIPYIILVVGIIAIVISILKIIKDAKKAGNNSPFENKVKEEEIDSSIIDKIKNDDSEEKEYYFHWTGKMNQSYILETPDRVPIYEAICNKIGVVKPYEYTFVNHLTGKQDNHKVTHTITKGYGNTSGNTSFSIVDSSSFKIDDINNWDYLNNLGYSIDLKREGIKLAIDVMHHGIVVAHLSPAGTNILKDNNSSKLGNIPGTGLYKVYCKQTDIEAVFLACFIASRVEFI